MLFSLLVFLFFLAFKPAHRPPPSFTAPFIVVVPHIRLHIRIPVKIRPCREPLRKDIEKRQKQEGNRKRPSHYSPRFSNKTDELLDPPRRDRKSIRTHGSLNSATCSSVSITLPASLRTRMTASLPWRLSQRNIEK